MRIQPGQMIALGYGKFVRSDEVVAVEGITESRGPGRRALVWVRGIETPLVASRSEAAIMDEITTPAEEAARARQQRSMLQRVVKTLDDIPGTYRRRLRETDGIDLDGLAQEANRILA